jgi:glycerol-3-phosphate dehydrogenase
VANYVEVQSFIKKDGKAVGVIARDIIGEREFEIFARKIVCAVGPWTNLLMHREEGNVLPLVRTTKGIHVVCAGQISDRAILFPTSRDQRDLFVIPWMGNSLIGTTDTDYTESPDAVSAQEEDIAYLFRELRRLFPDGVFTKDRIVTTFAGLRPLVHKQGEPAKISRKHLIKETYAGVVYVMGGKYTTYRKIAEDCLKNIIRTRPMIDARAGFPVFGSGKIVETAQEVAGQYGLIPEVVRYLMEFYGVRYKDVLRLTQNNPAIKEPLCTCSPAIKAQVVYAIETEMAVKDEDIIKRRLPLIYRPCRSGECVREIRKLIS